VRLKNLKKMARDAKADKGKNKHISNSGKRVGRFDADIVTNPLKPTQDDAPMRLLQKGPLDENKPGARQEEGTQNHTPMNDQAPSQFGPRSEGTSPTQGGSLGFLGGDAPTQPQSTQGGSLGFLGGRTEAVPPQGIPFRFIEEEPTSSGGYMYGGGRSSSQ